MQIKINNWNINYEVMGQGNPVILLHGWLANLETMRPIANELCKNFKVYLVDIVGFGKSDLPEPLSPIIAFKPLANGYSIPLILIAEI